MLETRQLSIFLTAAETGSFSQAARQLQISQPSVSQHIKGLEEKLKARLFHRNAAGRCIALTDAGQVLLPLAREMIQLATRTEETMNALEGQVVGRLKLGCSATTSKCVTPRLLARFVGRYPQVQVSCYGMTHEDVVNGLLDGALHLGVTSVGAERGKQITYRPFFSDRVVLVAPAGHPWAGLDQIEPQELLTAKFIVREKPSGVRRIWEEGLSGCGVPVSQLQMVVVGGDAEMVLTMVEEGIGIAFASRAAAAPRLRSGRIVEVGVANLDLRLRLYLARNVRRTATKTQNAFWDFVCESTQEGNLLVHQ